MPGGLLCFLRIRTLVKKLFNAHSQSMGYGFQGLQAHFPNAGASGAGNGLTRKPRHRFQPGIGDAPLFHYLFDVAYEHWEGFPFIC